MWTLVAIPAALAPAPTTMRSWSVLMRRLESGALATTRPCWAGLKAIAALRHPLRARLDRLQLDLLEHGAQHALHLLFGVAGGEAAAGAAAEGDPGRHRGALRSRKRSGTKLAGFS